MTDKFFSSDLINWDKDIKDAIDSELVRQQEQIELIASENIVSKAVMEAQGSVFTNKYAEGYPNKRYYGGCENADTIESIAIKRACELFGCNFANVQPHSGAQANGAVMLALLQPGDTILGMSLDSGGHLTHGARPAMSGKWFNAIQYGVDKTTYNLDYDSIEKLANEHKPKLIIAGTSAYSQVIDFKRFREIADKVGAYLMVDMAHIAGLVATGEHPSPIEYAHVVTSTTHKTLRGPRGGIILTNSEEIIKKINSAIFPGLQGGPLMHVVAAKAVCFKEALEPSFKEYVQQVKSNAKALAKVMIERGCKIISGSTHTHLMLVDLRPKGLTGDIVADMLEKALITCNKNAVPFDEEKPFVTSGIRFGTSAVTTRGYKEKEMILIGGWINDILDAMVSKKDIDGVIDSIACKVRELNSKFPLYS
jgi:glycine hydroxymethyltransferase